MCGFTVQYTLIEHSQYSNHLNTCMELYRSMQALNTLMKHLYNYNKLFIAINVAYKWSMYNANIIEISREYNR